MNNENKIIVKNLGSQQYGKMVSKRPTYLVKCPDCNDERKMLKRIFNKSQSTRCVNCSRKQKREGTHISNKIREDRFNKLEEYTNDMKILLNDIGAVPSTNGKYKIFVCLVQCPSCGKEHTKRRSDFKKAHTTECKTCRAKRDSEAKKQHGDTNTRLYKIWVGMKGRCLKNNHAKRKYYYDRGIAVCNDWIRSYEEFRDWALDFGYAEDLTLDRKDNDKGYNPENCRWVSRAVQAQNTRLLRDINTSGYRGVSKNGRRWVSCIKYNTNKNDLGTFDTAEEAAQAYNDFVIKHKTEHPLNKIK